MSIITKNKIALCISGMPRSFKRSYESLKEKVIDYLTSNGYEIKLYISTWNKRLETGRPTAQLDDGTIEEYIQLYSPYKFKIEEYTPDTEIKIIQHSNIKPSITSMFYKIKDCFELCDKDTDIYIRTRSDLLYLNYFPIEEIEEVIKNGGLFLRRDCCFNKELEGKCIFDQVALANYNDMNVYSSTYDNIPSLYKKVDKITPERILKKNLELNNIELKQSSFRYDIIRDSSLENLR